ncbi:MAG: tRNA (guanine-N2)-dimethyltransferase [Waddliaceae bacterium]|nr:tRNA (guanine-N2)-dimethyltransferase [Waddliaceae bacterium]
MFPHFSKKKFDLLSNEQKHKKSAELLRAIYDALLQKKNCIEAEKHYNELQNWLISPLLNIWTPETISQRYHEHLALCDQQHKEHNLLQSVKTEDRKEAAPLLDIHIYLDHIRSAHNVGSILRTTEAFGLGTLYFPESAINPEHSQVKKTSMGCSEWVEWHANAQLKKLHQPIIIAETSSVAIPLSDFIFPSQFTLVLGNEEYGCSQEVLDHADYIIEIPLSGRKNSLNVANAYTAIAYEISRQLRI